MVEMRIYEILKAQYITDYEYSWDAAYSKILVSDDFNTDTRTSTIGISGGSAPTYASTTIDFIFPFKYGYNMVLDGVSRGSTKIKVTGPTTGNPVIDIYCVASIIARTDAGVDRTLGTTTTKVLNTNANAGSTANYDIPFFIDVDNGNIDYNERLIFRLVVYARSTSPGSGPASFLMELTLNSNNTFIEIPVVQ